MKELKEYLPDHAPDPDSIVLGTISFPDILNEKEIGGNNRMNLKSRIGECKIEVRSREREIPHFHINSINGKFKSCVCIYSNNYFSHGQYQDTFNSDQCKVLDDWLKFRNTDRPGNPTNWERIANEWEDSNPECKFPKSRKVMTQPDYAHMQYFKDV